MADRRALTPSEAGELVVPSADEVRQDLHNASARMYRVITARVERMQLALNAVSSRHVFERPMSLIDERRQQLDEFGERAERSVRSSAERLSQNVATIAAALDALSPLKVLTRGYSLTTDAAGAVIRSQQDVAPDDELITRLTDGKIRSRVVSVDNL